MSIVSQVSNELGSLISESRRRNSDIRHASERSLSILKTYPSGTDEVVFLSELSHNSDFVTPFLLSCSTRNAKFITIAIQSLQKLIQFNAIPISKLDLVIEALLESTHLSSDIQLKVLQILPIFITNYSGFVNDALIPKTLSICSILQNANRVPMVINTAAATEQQIIAALFDKLNKDDGLNEIELEIDEGSKIKVSSNSYDCFRILKDICLLIEKQKAEFLPFKSMTDVLGFELLENLIMNYSDIFNKHVELGFLVRTKVVPILLRSFSQSNNFGIVVRIGRLILLLIQKLLDILEIEVEVILSVLNHLLTDSSNSRWKRLISLEIFHGVLSDFNLTYKIYSIYDYEKDRKNLLIDLFSSLSELTNESTRLLDIQEIVSIPSITTISLQNSSLRIPYLDQLDKSDIPTTPDTYHLILILNCLNLISDGIGKFTLEKTTIDGVSQFLTDLNSEQQNQKDILILKSLIVSNAKSLVSIGTEFLYSCLSNDLFHNLIRSLQKLCHSSGLLQLVKQRDSLLLLFSIATVSNVRREIVKRNSIGETLVETINSLTSTPAKETIKQHTRQLNARHVICFRALTSLTISLGPHLKKSWKFILITFQWFDYYLNGATSNINQSAVMPKPDLTSSDFKSLESLMIKFNETTKNYDLTSYSELIKELKSLANFSPEDVNSEPISNDKFKICTYNLNFYIKKIGEIINLNTVRYVEDTEDWKLINNFFIKSISDSDQKEVGCFTFNSFLREFGNELNSSPQIEQKLFNSLNDLINSLLNGSDVSMIEETLRTLMDLLDKFGNNLTTSWTIIINIIMNIFNNYKDSSNLLKLSFEILQFILNDFMTIIPLSNLKLIIDVLNQFCYQKTDLNVSFTAVSYYWLISDYLRQQKRGESKEIKNYEELSANLNSDDINILWLYLLNSLVKLSNDERQQVKTGAIQTFFRIVDSHGEFLNWTNTFNVVIKDLFKIEFTKDDQFKESVKIVLKGVIDVYLRYYITSLNSEIWKELLTFLKKLVNLDNVEITSNVYKSYDQILKSFSELNDELFELFFEFWSSQQIKYVSVDSNSVQQSLVELISSFSTLHKLHELNTDQVSLCLSTFNNCIRFPFLPFKKDFEKPTLLQHSVLMALSELNGSVVLINISNLVLLPFQTRSRIVNKLTKVDNIPTFISISLELIELLDQKLKNIDLLSLIEDKTLNKIIKNLIDSITYKSDSEEQQEYILKSEIWKKSSSLILSIIQRVITTSSPSLWKLIIEFTQTTLPIFNSNTDEQFNLSTYSSLKKLIIKHKESIPSDELIVLIESIWKSSFLYNNDELEDYLINSFPPTEITEKVINADIYGYSTERITQLKQDDFRLVCLKDLFEFIKTDKEYSNGSIINDTGNEQRDLLAITLPFLLCRLVLIIKRFENVMKLSNKIPVVHIQQVEMLLALSELLSLLKSLTNQNKNVYKDLILTVFPLILDNHQFIGKLPNAQNLLNQITREFYKITN